MLTALYGSTGHTSIDYTVYGDEREILDLSRLLEGNPGILNLALRNEGVAPYPHTGVFSDLCAEVRPDGRLKIERSGATLRITGPRDGMRTLARLLRETVEMTGQSPVGNVHLELVPEGGEPLEAGSATVTVEVSQYDLTG